MQLSKWKDAEKSVNDVFKLLELHKTKKKLFDSPMVRTWFDFAALSYQKRTTVYEALYTTLKAHYNDYELAEVLVKGLHIVAYHDTALELEKWQFSEWKDTGMSMADVSGLLKLAPINPSSTGHGSQLESVQTLYSIFRRQNEKRKFDTVKVVDVSPSQKKP